MKTKLIVVFLIVALILVGCGATAPKKPDVCGGVAYTTRGDSLHFNECKDGKTAVFTDAYGNKVYAQFAASSTRITQGQSVDLTAQAWARSGDGSIPYTFNCQIRDPNGSSLSYYVSSPTTADQQSSVKHDPSWTDSTVPLNNNQTFSFSCSGDNIFTVEADVDVHVFPPQ